MRRLVPPVLVALAVAGLWILALPAAPVDQPIAFNHARHAAVACAVCHRGAETAARAGIPQSNVCTRCHATAPDRSVSARAWSDVAAGRPIAWRQVTQVPEHVMFSHRRHTSLAQLACASCHGDAAARVTPFGAPATRIAMTTCLSCHTREGASEDCAACHR
ncbi:MAG: cytochrome c3 family protein [Acidobacteria bacterium]|nr:cytochrome c3 family protein [Acidobacteriota bacterium]